MAVSLSSIKSVASDVKSVFSSKATFKTEDNEVIPVQFNPEQFKITRGAHYSHTTKKEHESAYMGFSGTVVPQMDISFYFDTSGFLDLVKIEAGKETDVMTLTEKFSNLVNIKPSLHRPPIVEFIWGSTCFKGFVKNVSTTYTMFNKSGMPVRAKVDATLVGVGDKEGGKVPLESPDRTKNRVVSDETSIWGLANTEYDDISKWRVIAKANGIMDPFDIPAGTVLKVPALKE